MTDREKATGGPAPALATGPGQAVYSPSVLRLYDLWVLGFSNRVLWRCPSHHIEALYDRNVSADHLDIGVGTGYFLDRARYPDKSPTITLLDLNSSSLAAAARRIERFKPRCVKADAFEPLPLDRSFSSVALCYLLHCLPGRMADKAIVFDNTARVLRPEGRLFGATIVQGNAPRGAAARALMALYNAKGIFSNRDDTAETLQHELTSRFAAVTVEVIGCVALFEAKGPRSES